VSTAHITKSPHEELVIEAHGPPVTVSTAAARRGAAQRLKRAMDVTAGGLLLLVTAPLFALIALLIWADDRGPVFFRQVRAGQDMRPFPMLKFRTMHLDVTSPPAASPDAARVVRIPKPESDPRTTRIGRLLRATSLDELPQLFNVLKGDMSLVGPRPEEYRLVLQWPPEALERLQLKPGLTGPMQIHGRGLLTFEERLALETHYLHQHSLRGDLVILLKTVLVVFRRDGAY
jgi:lipopolysaccharide/colanic/teichoic acid biosynthesis glycosyltransferase